MGDEDQTTEQLFQAAKREIWVLNATIQCLVFRAGGYVRITEQEICDAYKEYDMSKQIKAGVVEYTLRVHVHSDKCMC